MALKIHNLTKHKVISLPLEYSWCHSNYPNLIRTFYQTYYIRSVFPYLYSKIENYDFMAYEWTGGINIFFWTLSQILTISIKFRTSFKWDNAIVLNLELFRRDNAMSIKFKTSFRWDNAISIKFRTSFRWDKYRSSSNLLYPTLVISQ